MKLSHRIRLYPNNKQATYMARAAGVTRFAWNWGLARWKELYEAGGKPSWQGLSAELNAIKREQFPWMLEVTKWAPNKSLNDLGNAFTNFFRRVKDGDIKKGYPKFKKKGKCKEQFYVAGEVLKFDGHRVRISKLGWVKMAESVRFPGHILGARFSRRAGKWYISVHVKVDEHRWSYPHRCESQAVVGVDLGLIHLAIPSKGKPTDAPRALRFYERGLKRLQWELARRTKGGLNWRKTKLKIQKTYEKIANTRGDVTHKLTAELIRNFRWIGIEDLNVKGMAANKRLAKSVLDAALFEVRRQLEYKALLAGNTVVVADRFYPSSKRCSACGHILKDLSLSVRKWICPICFTEHDRDRNAAINLEQLAAGYAVKACGAGSSGDAPVGVVKLSSMKQESSDCRPKKVAA